MGAGVSAFRVALAAGRIGYAVVGDAQDITNGDFGWVAGEPVTAVHAAATDDEAGATKLEENLFEVFDGDAIARSDFVNRDDIGMLHGEMENRSRRVLAFCRNSHKFGGETFIPGRWWQYIELGLCCGKVRLYWRRKSGTWYSSVRAR